MMTAVRLALALAVVVLAGCSEAPARGVLRVCLGDDDPPRSELPGRGFDLDTARLLARQLNRTLEVQWQPRPNLREIESSDINFSRLISGACDAQLSIPGEGAFGRHSDVLILSAPYYGTSFELIPDNATLASSGKIAVRANTVAHVLLDARGQTWTMQPDSASVALAVTSGEADTGLIWGPDLALTSSTRNQAFVAPPVLRWNQHLAFHVDNTALRDAVNAILPELQDRIISLLKEHGLPPHHPFDRVHRSNDLEAL